MPRLCEAIKVRYPDFPLRLVFDEVEVDGLLFRFELGEKITSITRQEIDITSFGDSTRRFIPSGTLILKTFEELKHVVVPFAAIAASHQESFYDEIEEAILLFIHTEYGQELSDEDDD